MKAGGLWGAPLLQPRVRPKGPRCGCWEAKMLRTTNSNLAEAQASRHVTCDPHWVMLRVKRDAANNHAEKINANQVRLRQAGAVVTEVLGNPQTQQGLMKEVRARPAPPPHRCRNWGDRGEKTCCPNWAQTRESRAHFSETYSKGFCVRVRVRA